MFSLRIVEIFIASQAMGNLVILKSVGKCEIYQDKGSHENPWTGFDEKISPGGRDLVNFGNLPQGCRGCNPWKILLLVYCIVAKVCRLRIRSHLVSLAK